MYRFGRRLVPWQNYRQRAVAMVVIVLLVVSATTAWLIENNRGTTIIHNASAKTTTVSAASPTVQTFNEATFSIQLPNDWKLISHTNEPYNVYTWQDTTRYEDNRILNLYVDTIPSTAVSRLQPVTVVGDHLQLGELSDACINFTGPPVTSAQAAQSLPNQVAKWQGINFICNLSNYNNNSIGTSSVQGINTVTLSGPITGQHSFFFLYIDHNVHPDYSIFTNALTSFRVN